MTNEPKPCLEGCGPSERWPTRLFHELGCPNFHQTNAQEPRVASVKGLCSVCGLPPDGKRGCCKPAEPSEKGSGEGKYRARDIAEAWKDAYGDGSYTAQSLNTISRAYLALRAELAAAQKEITELRKEYEFALAAEKSAHEQTRARVKELEHDSHTITRKETLVDGDEVRRKVNHFTRVFEDHASGEPKQGSEEGIDWEAASEAARKWIALPTASPGSPGPNGHLARAYLALREDQADWRKGVALIASSLAKDTLSCSHLAMAALKLRADNEILRAQLDAKEKEIADWRTWGIIEIMVRNANVDSFVREKERELAAARAAQETAEAMIAEMIEQHDALSWAGKSDPPVIAKARAILARRNKEKE